MTKKQKAQTLSIIIPVYNEENYIRACLESIAAQTVKPLEVIVVDNNSLDATTDIVKRFSFARIIREKRQHQAFAQHAGFSAAKGDIVGRIDADTILPRTWVSNVLKAFSENEGVVAVSGSGNSYDVILKGVGEFIFRRYYQLSSAIAGHKLMWGSNCAFRRSAWKSIKDDLILREDIWEDYDLAFSLAAHGKIIWIDNRVSVSYRAVNRSLGQMVRYQFRSIRTFYYRKGLFRAALFGMCWSSLALIVPPFIVFDFYILQPIKNLSVVRLLFGSSRG